MCQRRRALDDIPSDARNVAELIVDVRLDLWRLVATIVTGVFNAGFLDCGLLSALDELKRRMSVRTTQSWRAYASIRIIDIDATDRFAISQNDIGDFDSTLCSARLGISLFI